MSDYKGAALVFEAMPDVRELIGDKGYDGDWFRSSLAARGTTASIPSKRNCKVAIPHNPVLNQQPNKIGIMPGRLEDWRRIHTRYDRCAHAFFSAICIAATVMFWLPKCLQTLEKSRALTIAASQVCRHSEGNIWLGPGYVNQMSISCH